MLLIGLGIGALASQLGAVTVSAVPDDQSPEVGGVQNTMTNLGASIGTALAGSILIAAADHGVPDEHRGEPGDPGRGEVAGQVELAGGVPFVSDADLEAALDDAGVDLGDHGRGTRRLRGRPHRRPAVRTGDPRTARIVALFLAQTIPTRPIGKAVRTE